MIVSALLAARAFLAKLPWQLWVVLAVLLTAFLWGNHRYSQGVQAERNRWVAQIAAGKARADEATITAANKRATDTERNNADDKARTDAARIGGRTAANCKRLRQAGTDLRSVAACR